jgi:hypothetical protein
MNKQLFNPSAPSISSAAMLVELNISTWTARKQDKRASEEVTSSNHADKHTARVNKDILGNCAELDAIRKFVANNRNLHYSMTMPWSDSGLRLLPTAQYFKYQQEMTAIRNEFERLTNIFLAVYDDAVIEAQLKLGNLFNRDDYPTTESIASKFAFRINYIPLPDAGDFRIDIGNEATAQLRAEYDEFYQNMLGTAMRDIWTRLHDSLKHVTERLDYSDDNKKRYHNTLIPNLLDIVELMGTCNVTNDSQMTAIQQQLETALRGVTTEAVKEDEYLRRETKRNLDHVIKQLPSLDF